MKTTRKLFCLILALLMVFSLSAFALAEDITPSQESAQVYTYEAPTAPMTVNDNIVTATAHRAASPSLGMMGVNAVSGFGMINGGAPANYSEAIQKSALGVWGSSINSNPDPYYWNYFYNFYAADKGLPTVEDALLNTAVSASPVMADKNLLEEYGNISISLARRPDVVVGCASGNGSADTNGYDDQLATIHSFAKDSPYYQPGDETYSPKLVSYQTTYIKQMIESMHRLADAITAVMKETGKTTRYEDPQKIANDYEKYVYGIVGYVHQQLQAKGLPEKTVAVVTAINEDGTYTLADSVSRSATSLVRAYEYTMCVSDSLVDKLGSTTATLDQLLTADAIVTINNTNITHSQMLESFGDKTYDGILVASSPATLYGMTMNSVENAMGYAYVIGSIYSDVIDINPVELSAYFYQHFLHISDLNAIATVVKTNYASVVLPKGISATLPANYSDAAVQAKIDAGINYIKGHQGQFRSAEYTVIGIDSLLPDVCVATRQNLTVDGKAVNTEIYNINGYNYFKLRDVAYMLNGTGSQYSVAYDEAQRTISLVTGEPYVSVGGELAAGKDASSTFVRSNQPLIINGEAANLTAYNIGGYNFFKLRDLGSALNFDVDYDEATKTMLVTSK